VGGGCITHPLDLSLFPLTQKQYKTGLW